MKKLFLSLMLGILCGFTAYAQCDLYRFTERTEAYTPLTTATRYDVQAGTPLDFILLNDGQKVAYPQSDSAITGSAAIALGFDFEFAGRTYDRFVVSANGFIVLVEKDANNIAISGITAGSGNQGLPDHAIGLAGKAATANASCEAVDGSCIRYATAGEDGQKTLTVEFEKIGYVCKVNQGNTWGKTDLTYMLTLHENGAIAFHFGHMNFLQQNSYSFNMGLRSDYMDCHFRKPNSEYYANKKNDHDWTSTEMTKKVYPDDRGNSFTLIEIGRGVNVFPDGTYWLFQQAEECQAPENATFNFQVEEIKVDAGYFELNITSPERNFDGVVVGISNIEPTDDFHPTDGDEFESMDEASFGYVVYSNQEWTTCFPTSGLTLEFEEYYDPEEDDGDWLEAGETYYVSVYPYNYICEDGDILYGTPSVFSFTMPETISEEALSVTACTNEAITLKLEDNDETQEFAIVATPFIDFEASHVYGEDRGYFGSFRADMKVGDTLYLPDGGFGGVIVYIGTPDEDITYDKVQPNTIYYFGAFKKNNSDYSALYATAYDMTPAVFPFAENFTQHPASQIAGGWVTDFARFKRNRNGLIYAETGGDPFVTLPAMTLPNQEVRLELNYLMFYVDNYQYRGIKRALWEAGDSIIVEISQNGNDYIPVYAIDRYNADDFVDGTSYLTRTMNFRIPEAAPTRIRLRWKVRFGERYTVVRISEIRVVETPACDHPSFVYVADNTVSDSRAIVDWHCGISEETHWRIAYAEADGSENLQWSEPKEITEHPYTLDNLKNNTAYRARVQAMCNLGEYSDWTYSNDFMTLYDIPMKEDFENLQNEIYKEIGHVTMLKTGWAIKQTPLKDTVKLGQVVDVPIESERSLKLVEWRHAAIGYNDAGRTNGSVMYQCGHKKKAWLEMPVLNFGQGNENYMLSFDIAIADDKDNSVHPLHESTKLYIFYSTDTGKTYRAADSLMVFHVSHLEAFGDSARVVIPLEGLKGQCRLAFFFTSEATTDFYERIYIDNIEVYATCLIARDVRYADLTDHSVSLSWRPIPQVEQWVVKLESEDATRQIETNATEYTFDDLNARTTYTASIGHLCGTDMSDWQTVTFTTGGIPCDPVSNLTAERISTKTANLTWNGEAAAYHLQIRKANGTEWVSYTVNGTSRELANLEPDQTYEWRVQSVCGEAIGDTSAYSEVSTFKTLAVTCFPPEGLRVLSQNFYSAILTWTGTPDETFEISYKTATETAYSKTVTAHGDSAHVMGLTAEESYSFRIRRVCSPTENSAWSEAVTAIIPAVPVCQQPTNLRSAAITDTSAQLSWDSEDGLSCILRFRTSTASVWDSVKNLTEQSYVLANLQPNTAYLWSVMSLCEYNLSSDWARQASFTTLNRVSNERTLQNSFRLYAVLGQLHILNDGQTVIESVEILDRAGRLLQKHAIGHADHVIIPTTLNGHVVLVRIYVQGGQAATYKLHL